MLRSNIGLPTSTHFAYYGLKVFWNLDLLLIGTYISDILKDGFLNLFIGNLILYVIPFTLLYIKKRLRKKIFNQ
jgi:hypothetical protein